MNVEQYERAGQLLEKIESIKDEMEKWQAVIDGRTVKEAERGTTPAQSFTMDCIFNGRFMQDMSCKCSSLKLPFDLIQGYAKKAHTELQVELNGLVKELEEL